MSTEFISQVDDPTQREAGPSTGSWSTHKSGDAEGSFPDMDVDADLDRVSVIESLCMNCHEQGLTKLLLTRIPYFRDIVVMSFECPHCNVRSAEVQPANDLALKAVRATLTVDVADVAATKADLNRQVIKSETCRVLIPEADFEIPANGTRGDINTIEGVLSNIADSLQAEQGNRELGEPERAAKIQAVIDQFRLFASGAKSFTFVLDDLAGNVTSLSAHTTHLHTCASTWTLAHHDSSLCLHVRACVCVWCWSTVVPGEPCGARVRSARPDEVLRAHRRADAGARVRRGGEQERHRELAGTQRPGGTSSTLASQPSERHPSTADPLESKPIAHRNSLFLRVVCLCVCFGGLSSDRRPPR